MGEIRRQLYGWIVPTKLVQWAADDVAGKQNASTENMDIHTAIRHAARAARVPSTEFTVEPILSKEHIFPMIVISSSDPFDNLPFPPKLSGKPFESIQGILKEVGQHRPPQWYKGV
jgi:hypothetical protein